MARLAVLILLLALCLAVSVGARGIWGSRKKREAEEVEVEVAATGFEASRRQAAAAAAYKQGDGAGVARRAEGAGAGTGFGSANFGNEMRVVIEKYLGMMEEAIESPEFQASMTPEVLRTMLDQIPALADNPQVMAVLESPEFTDPDKLMQTIRTGMTSMRAHTNEIVSVLNSPEKIAGLVQQLPVEFRGALQGLLRGDTSGVLDLLDGIPNLTDAHKDMVKGLLSGNTKGIEQSLKSLMGDKSQLEAARQQMLANPEMMEMMGIDASVLQDKVKFAEMMSQGMDAFAGMGGEDEENEAALGGKRFGQSQAA